MGFHAPELQGYLEGDEEGMPCTCSHLTHAGVINGVFWKTGWLCGYSAGEALKGGFEKVPGGPGVLPVRSFQENEY